MIQWINRYKKGLLVFGGISMLIPLFYITYIIATAKEDSTQVSVSIDSVFANIIFAYYIILIVALMAYALYSVFKNIKSIVNLKNEKAKTELKLLRSQVSPHFFFNMLNNLYGLVDIDPNKTKQLILKLSDMMRYSIYEGQNDTTTIKEELDFISDYIELHRMRYHKSIDVAFETDVKNYTIEIMPLLFIILVENAFKHGVEALQNDAFIRIKLVANDDKVFFEIENNFDITNEIEKGIGLKNLKRRLELVCPKKHKFSTEILKDTFRATLEIQL
ncbi:sensor histidine kinase [uncultured Psychroserpens sp.]|uniref:sensor histidine kinase n=1 Tax=uncultured Psychroserpens sp. TaxID=255436 RepID=UPI00260CE854|nr:histidine kinase [uncultured Psychroserpens sp.]